MLRAGEHLAQHLHLQVWQVGGRVHEASRVGLEILSFGLQANGGEVLHHRVKGRCARVLRGYFRFLETICKQFQSTILPSRTGEGGGRHVQTDVLQRGSDQGLPRKYCGQKRHQEGGIEGFQWWRKEGPLLQLQY